MGFRGQDQFRTDPTGVLAAGFPGSGRGSGEGVTIGGINPSRVPPAVQTAGSQGPGPRAPGGGGIIANIPFGGSGGASGGGGPGFNSIWGGTTGTLIKRHAKGGAVKTKTKAKKMAEGGSADMAQDKAMIRKAFKQHDAQEHKGGKGTKLKLAKGGKAKKMAKGGSASSRADGCCSKGKTKGRFI